MTYRLALIPLALAAVSACAVPASGGGAPGPAWAGIGMRVVVGGVAVTPLEVIEDSRCPASVQCIQAGTVRLRAAISAGGADQAVTVGLKRPADLGGRWLHLLAACPARAQPGAIAPAAYRFAFALAPAPAYDGAVPACG